MSRIALSVVASLLAFSFASARSVDPIPHATRGRAAFEIAWQAWSQAPAGPEKDALALEVDRLAGQRYATVSRLYWHRDLASAIAAAGESGRPILALRMLGNLDEDLSCANSRLFRVVLYADGALSDYLREHFELTWDSVRDVPRVTIDFGDGRVLERTITGNSAHLVLDRRGRPVDVLPGLYGPRLFREALEPAEALAREVAELEAEALAEALAAHHAERLALSEAFVGPEGRPTRPPTMPTLMGAEHLTRGKRMMEIGMVKGLALGLRDASLDEPDERRWKHWRILAQALPSESLDASSRALFATFEPANWNVPGTTLDGTGLEALRTGFERDLTVEGVANEHGLHAEIHRWFAARHPFRDLAALQYEVYSSLFLTPTYDRWLGLATPSVFSALPRDGLTVEQKP